MIILQYVHILSHYVVHLKLIYVSYITIKKKSNNGKQPKQVRVSLLHKPPALLCFITKTGTGATDDNLQYSQNANFPLQLEQMISDSASPSTDVCQLPPAPPLRYEPSFRIHTVSCPQEEPTNRGRWGDNLPKGLAAQDSAKEPGAGDTVPAACAIHCNRGTSRTRACCKAHAPIGAATRSGLSFLPGHHPPLRLPDPTVPARNLLPGRVHQLLDANRGDGWNQSQGLQGGQQRRRK